MIPTPVRPFAPTGIGPSSNAASTTFRAQEILDTAGFGVGDADVLIGGPPCQPFSKSGYWASGDTKRLNDPRANTLNAYMRVVEDTLPKTFFFENVEGVAYKSKAEALKLLLDQIAEINRRTGSNYQPEYKVLSAADFGVPQLRSRFFMIASRDGTPFQFP